jgi:hypothetical protein
MFSRRVWTFVLTVMLVPVVSAAQGSQGPRLVLPDFDHLAKRASESVNLSLDTSLLSLAAGFLDGNDPDEQSVKEFVGGLRGIYVRSFDFDADREWSESDIEPVRRQLSGGAWTRLMGVRSKRENADVEVYLALDGQKVQGLALVVAGARNLTIVNIVGSIDLERLRKLEGQLGIPKLGIEKRDKKDDQ